MSELIIKRQVMAKPYPRQYEVDRTPMIRLYKSSPSGATLQLRGKNAYASADYIERAEVLALIVKLQEIERELQDDVLVIVPSQLMREHEIDEEADERGSEG